MTQLKLDFHHIELLGRDDEPFTFNGARLGHGTSYRSTHNHDLSRDRYTPRGVRCSACRWFEVDIYVTSDGRYVVHTVGESILPREDRRSRVSQTHSAFEVVELLTIRRQNEEPFMMAQSAGALAQASELDDGIREAYINRAVV